MLLSCTNRKHFGYLSYFLKVESVQLHYTIKIASFLNGFVKLVEPFK